MTYNLAAWKQAARRLTIDGDTIRLDGFRSPFPDAVTVTGRGRQRRTLLVVPPGADPRDR